MPSRSSARRARCSPNPSPDPDPNSDPDPNPNPNPKPNPDPIPILTPTLPQSPTLTLNPAQARVLQGGQLQHVLNERGALSRLAGNAFLLQLVASYQVSPYYGYTCHGFTYHGLPWLYYLLGRDASLPAHRVTTGRGAAQPARQAAGQAATAGAGRLLRCHRGRSPGALARAALRLSRH